MMKDQQNILLELTSISPFVADLPKNTPFEAPEGYFKEFSSRIIEQIQVQNIDKEVLSPLMQSLKKENPFSVPVGYMSQFNVDIAPKKTKIVPLFRINTVLKYAAAASIIGIIATFATLFFSNIDKSEIGKSNGNAMISTDAFALYLSEAEIADEEDALETVISDSESLLVQMDAKVISELLTEIPENEISNYIDIMKSEDPNLMN
jgi:hypothetical protein